MSEHDPPQPAPRRRLKKRYLAGAVLLLLAVPATLLIIQLVRISLAVPGVVGDYPQKFRDLIQAQQPHSPKGRDAFVIIAEAKQRLDDLRMPIYERVEQERITTFDSVFRQTYPDTEYLTEPAIDADDYFEDDPEWVHIDPFNELIRSTSYELLNAYKSSDIQATLDTIGPTTPAVIDIPDRILIDTLLPSLGESRILAKWETACMAHAAKQESWDDYQVSAGRIFALAEVNARSPTLICGLVGYAIESLLHTRLFNDISTRQLPPETLDAIDVMLNEHAGPTPISLYFEGERLFILDIIDRTHSDNGNGDGFYLPASMVVLSEAFTGPPPGPSVANIPGLLSPSKAETVANVDRLYERWVERARTPPHQRSDAPLDADSSTWNPILDIMIPAVSKAITAHDKVACERAAARVAIAIERYRVANARLPESLDDLAPEFIDSLPADPFAQDARLRYRVDESCPRGYTLYSVGRDSQDDGGSRDTYLWSDDLDSVFIPWIDD